jgi:hypothetical protein
MLCIAAYCYVSQHIVMYRSIFLCIAAYCYVSQHIVMYHNTHTYLLTQALVVLLCVSICLCIAAYCYVSQLIVTYRSILLCITAYLVTYSGTSDSAVCFYLPMYRSILTESFFLLCAFLEVYSFSRNTFFERVSYSASSSLFLHKVFLHLKILWLRFFCLQYYSVIRNTYLNPLRLHVQFSHKIYFNSFLEFRATWKDNNKSRINCSL